MINIKKIINLDVIEDLRNMTGRDDDIFKSLVSIYLEDSPRLLQQLKNSKNNKQIRDVVHPLKSSSASLGATKLSELCHNFENEACHDDNIIENIDNKISQIIQEFKYVNIAMLNLLDNL
jgi:HPt (histidine-containing phosphotransfer) domain-containing protein